MVRITDRPDMTLDVYRGRKTTIQQQQQHKMLKNSICNQGFIVNCHTLVEQVVSRKSPSAILATHEAVHLGVEISV